MAQPEKTDLFGDIAVEIGFVTPDQVEQALAEQQRLAEAGTQKLIGEVFVGLGVLTMEQVAGVLQTQKDRRGAKVRKVGPYEIVEKVGAGGMGAVYRARDTRTGKHVALKILPQRLAADERYLKRFSQEAEMAMQLDHENIVKGLGSGKDAGLHYFAMEFVNGENIQDMIARVERFPEETALMIILPVARALDHAHEHGLVHQDIKPENIIMDPKGVIKLLDLGLARRADDLTKSTLGTPLYVSPEHVAGDRPLDIRSDIYSLGVTLYHMVTGSPPFVGTDERDTMARHVEDEIPWPQDVVPELSDQICQVITRMLAKDADDRYGEPKQLIFDVEAVLGRRPPRYAIHGPGEEAGAGAVTKPAAAAGERKQRPAPPGQRRPAKPRGDPPRGTAARRKVKSGREPAAAPDRKRPAGRSAASADRRRRTSGRQLQGKPKGTTSATIYVYAAIGIIAGLVAAAIYIMLD
jgi:serine/threonine-protein kinase